MQIRITRNGNIIRSVDVSPITVSFVRIETILYLLLCKGVLDYSYVKFISPVFSYAGFTFESSPVQLIVSYFIVACLAAMTPLDRRRPSSAFVFMFLLMIIVPIVSLWALRGDDSTFMLLILACFLTILGIQKTPIVTWRLYMRNGEGIVKLLFWSLLVYLSLIIWQRQGISFLTFDFAKVYDSRVYASEQVFFGFAAYAKEWLGKVALPALIVLSLMRKQFLALAVLIVIEWLLAGFTTAKEYFIYPMLIIVTYYIVKNGWQFQRTISQLIILALLAALAIGVYTELLIIPAVVIQRPFFVIARLHYEYYYFFDHNPHVYLSNTALSFLASYPYKESIPNIIGYGLWGGETSSFANVGVFASGFMHFGIAGMFIFSIIVGIILKIFDVLVIDRMPIEVGVAVGIVPAMQLVNGDLTASLLSHGLALSLLVLFLLGNLKWSNRGDKSSCSPPIASAG